MSCARAISLVLLSREVASRPRNSNSSRVLLRARHIFFLEVFLLAVLKGLNLFTCLFLSVFSPPVRTSILAGVCPVRLGLPASPRLRARGFCFQVPHLAFALSWSLLVARYCLATRGRTVPFCIIRSTSSTGILRQRGPSRTKPNLRFVIHWRTVPFAIPNLFAVAATVSISHLALRCWLPFKSRMHLR